MSSDNGIYIGRFLRKNGKYVYRVEHLQAIENTDEEDEDLRNAYIASCFGRSKEYNTISDALKRAEEIYQEITDSEFSIIEYGIQHINYDIEFPDMSPEEAERIIHQYYYTSILEELWIRCI